MATGNPLFVGSARTALKVAIQQLGLAKGERILLPDFICDVLLHPIDQTSLIPVYYPIAGDFAPDWNVLESIVAASKCRALVMVHYFGQPQDIERFRHFCAQHTLLLVEDNAHGYGGCIGGQALGSFGDVGVGSPRKLLGTPSGGVLTGADERSFELVRKMKAFPAYLPNHVLRTLVHSWKPAWRLLKSLSDGTKDWSDPRRYRETIKPDCGIDQFSRWRIRSADWVGMAKQRRENWSAWAGFARNKGLRPVFREVHPESCPWALPVCAQNLAERNSWLAWGRANRIPIFPWPVLPEEVVSWNGKALALWKTMLCFPLDVAPRGIRG